MAMQRMKLSQFRYDVPEELVAQYPLDNRDDSRLMIINRETGTFEHRMFKDVVDIFDEAMSLWRTTPACSLPRCLATRKRRGL